MKAIFIAILFAFGIQFGMSQDLNFSQFYHNKTLINPAYTGLNKSVTATGLHRNQWMGVGDENLFQSTAIVLDYGLSEKSSGKYGSGLGFGLIYTHSTTGISRYTTDEVKLNISSDAARIGKEKHGFMAQLPVGISIGYINQGYDWQSLVFSDQLDPVLGVVSSGNGIPTELINQSESKFLNVGFGGMFGLKFHKKRHQATYANIGYSFEKYISINHNTSASYQIPNKWNINAFYHQPIHENMISSGVIYQSQGNLQNFIIGAAFVTEYNFSIGTWLRNQYHGFDIDNYSDLIFNFTYHYKQFQFGYAYDMGISSLSNKNSKGTHEISIKIQLFDDRKRVDKRIRSNSTCFFQGLG
ncbi:MAG: PorP/SprF family type IX secretion system membrane protein [Bacteroidota bacterium]|nr:PorP/SprF family type IX secretion system membrane protein [Bacteroidota bacterium]